MAIPQPRNPNLPPLPDLTQQPPNGLQAATPFGSQQAMAQAQFTGAGSDPQNQADLALARQFTQQRQANGGATFDNDLQRRIDEFYAQAERSLNPQWETRAREFEQGLVGRGIDPNSEAGQRARADFDRSRNDAFNSARNQATQFGAGLQQQRWQQDFASRQMEEQARNANAVLGANQMNLAYDRDWRQRQFDEDRRRYDQGFGEDTRRFDSEFDMQSLMTLLGFDRQGTAMNNQFGQAELQQLLPFLSMIPQGGPAGLDVMSPYQLQMQGQQAASNQANQMNNGFWGGLGTLGQIFRLSDARAKQEIRQVGVLHNGLPIYAYRYGAGGPTEIGVLAQDVEAVNPDAVIEVDGVKLVNYDKAVE